jgi:dihydrolipoamide dehydrogenase
MDFDVIVIGAGPGGYPAAIRAAQLGLKTACVERDKLGGVCLNWGCIPSKALLKSAELANKIRHASDFGLVVPTLEVDFGAVVARSRKVAERHERGVAGLFKKYGVTHVTGEATLEPAADGGAPVVRVGDRALRARHVILATGARAKVFPSMVVDGERVVTYREAIVRTERPTHAVVLGAGAIGLEFAYFWRGMGAEVTVVEGMPEILPREDVDVAKECRKQLEKSGIQFRLGTFVESAARDGDGAAVVLKGGEVLRGDVVLCALGIVPNSQGLGLEALGVATERGFVVVDDAGATNVRGLYAVGDLTPRGGLAHTATRQAEHCVETIAGQHPPKVRSTDIPSATYCQPQVASVGLTEAQAKEQGLAVKVGRFPFQANGKAQGAGTPEGFVKVLIGATHGEIVGAHIVGADATEMIAEFVLARANELTADEILHAVHAHPTCSEAMFEAVALALGRTVHL